jgi:cytochrome P450 family 307 subfamily A
LNNYELNKDPEYWENPLEFQPERFIKEGRVVKPSHFIPFGTGKRTCIGQQLVYGFSFVMVAAITQHFDVNVTDPKHLKLRAACVALPPDLFSLNVRSKNRDFAIFS